MVEGHVVNSQGFAFISADRKGPEEKPGPPFPSVE